MQNIDIHKAGGILIKERKLLTTRAIKSDIYIPPGGSIEQGETPEAALIRELEEELSIKVLIKDLKYFGTFEAKAAGQEDKIVQIEFFTVKEWIGELKANMEVEEIKWINTESLKALNVGSIFAHDVIPKLKALDLID